VEPSPEVGQVREDVGAGVFRNEAVVRRDDNRVGAVDERDEVGREPGGVETVACDLCMLALVGDRWKMHPTRPPP
jgi:hypothetical protein